jgi:6-phosphofructokinase 1
MTWEKTLMKRIAVMTSGGDAPGMNSAIRAVVRTGLAHGVEVYGIRQAYSGLLSGDMELLTSREVSGILQRGGTILQTARNEEFKTTQGQRKALRRLNELGIEGMIVIGGDGSLRGAQKLHELGVPVVGVPASIDNDIYGTDMAIGVDTALNTIIDALDRLRDTATSHNRCFLVEVMGRNCGYLALMGGICGGAEVFVIPEEQTPMEKVADSLADAYVRGKTHAIAVIAEGAPFKITDLEDYLQKRNDVGFEVRLTILGHTQRGGSPSGFDRLLASRLGMQAVELLLEGKSGIMVARQGREQTPITLHDATTKMRAITQEYIDMAHMLSR